MYDVKFMLAMCLVGNQLNDSFGIRLTACLRNLPELRVLNLIGKR